LMGWIARPLERQPRIVRCAEKSIYC